MLKRIVTAAIAAVLAVAASAPAVHAQKALVYCPVGIDATGCDRIVTALQPKFTDGVDRGYDGSNGTVDLTKIDVHHYGVFVVPSLADDGTKQPYALLHSVASRLHFAITGRVAVYSGAPDLGNSNRSDKDALIQNLATWAANGHSRATGLVGLVAFLDLSEHAADRYSWVRDISLTDVSADAQLTAFSDVQAVSARGTSVMAAGGRSVRFSNMASYGLHIGRHASARTEVGALGGTSGAQSVLVMYSNADGKDGATTGAGAGQVGSTGASLDVSAAKATLSTTSTTSSTASTTSTSGPTLTTDKADYLPGDTVTFTGTGFAPGDTVTITVHEDPTWSYPDRQVKSIADGNGAFTNRDMVVATQDLGVTFTATAVGNPSGDVAQTTFTDGSVTLTTSSSGISVTAHIITYTTSGCSGSATNKPDQTFTSTPSSQQGSVGGLTTGESAKITFASVSPSTATFTGWSTLSLNNATFAVDATTNSICVSATSSGVSGSVVANVTATQTANITISSSNSSSTFGQSVTFTATASAANATGSIQFRIDGSDFGAPAALSATATSTASISLSMLSAGSHSVTAVYTPGSGFTAGTVNTISQSVSPKAVLITPTAGETKVYGASDPTLTFSNDGGLAAVDFTGTLSRVAGEDVGNYAITLGTLSAGPNYSLSLPATAVNFAITPKAVVITPNSGQFKIFGVADPTLAFTNDASLAASAFTGALSRVAGENVGTYAITVGTLSAGANYSLSLVTPGVTFEIKPKPVVITPGAGQFKIFGAVDPTLTYANDGGVAAGSFTGTLSRVTGEDVGTYAITLGTLSAGPNYSLSMVTPVVTFEIKPKTVVITPDANQSKVYGTITDPTLTFTNDGGVASNQFTGSLSRAVGEIVGSYAINIGSLSAGTNYTLTLAATIVNFAITKKDVTVSVAAGDKFYDGNNTATITSCTVNGKVGSDDVTCGAASATFASASASATTQTVTAAGITLGGTMATNYNLPTTSATTQAKINPRPITVTADAKTKAYGDLDPALTYQITTGSLVSGESLTGALTRVSGENVGSYPIQQGTLTAGSNYSLTYASANLTITPRPITVTANPQSKVYGEADPIFTYKLTSGTLVNEDPISGTLARAAGENVGTYAINKGTLTAGGNYDLTYVSANLAITARPITVTADPQTKVYGEPDPALTYKISSGNLVSPDAFSGGLSRVAGTNVGAYAIQQGTLTAGTNYNLSYVGANLTITQRPITVTADPQAKTYGDADPALTYKVTAGDLVGSDAFTGALGRVPGETVADVPYAIQRNTLSAGGNYTLTYVGASLSITPRPITVMPVAPDLTWTGSPLTPNYSTSISSGALGNSDEISALGTASASYLPTTVTDVGTYASSETGLSNSNYTISYAAGTVKVLDKSAPFGTITSLNPVPLNTSATLTVNFNDVNTGNSKIVSWQYTIDGGTAVTLTVPTGSQTPNANLSTSIAGFATTDVKRVCVAGTDAYGNTSAQVCGLLAIYDPSTGFVTGGGWINSPAGAYAADLSLSGRANFGFVSKYQKGANTPTGNTEFQFQAGNLNFHSTSFQWLVISGTTQAQFKGSGTINGAGNYTFIVTAIDGDNFSTKQSDAFRIKITDALGAVIYDNQPGPDTSGAAQPISGGSIQIQSK